VEINQEQQYQSEQEPQDDALTLDSELHGVSEHVPVVRSNTPRPLSFTSMLSQVNQEQGEQSDDSFQLPRFPSIAPSAPPLPEELGEEDETHSDEIVATDTLAAPDVPASPTKAIMDSGGQEFTWLFEYGLEMDAEVLNSPECLNGAALLYGPAVLPGYTLVLGSVERQDKKEGSPQTVATIVADTTPGAEVWGVLYRIPMRLSECTADGPSRLDTIHAARTAQSLFCAVQVTVNDPKRKREIACVTYAVNENVSRLITFAPVGQASDTLFVQRLLETARKHKLPDKYLDMYASQSAAASPVSNGHSTVTTMQPAQDTDPLPVMKEKSKVPTLASILPETPLASIMPQTVITSAEPRPNRLLMAFAIYLVITLLAGLVFAIVQGLGLVLPGLGASFAPLNVPWLVMFYGLLGGCISCIVMLARYRAVSLPHFVIVGWFTRPYIGAVLAALAYLLLNSGIFALRAAEGQQQALSLLAGAIAGLCEGWIFFRWK
jgi:hypothetical protein